MRIGIIGAGPAGLYFALLMKRMDRRHQVTVAEKKPRDATYGFGVVFSSQALAFLQNDDPVTHDLLTARTEIWPDLTIVHRDQAVAIDGNGFASIARLDLLRLLRQRCEAYGVTLHYETPVESLDAFADFDLIVGADGVDSQVRQLYADRFQPQLRWLHNRFIWYGTTQLFPTLTLTFRSNTEGSFVAHHYRYSANMSTFIVECDAATWERAGFEQMPDEQSRSYCEHLFASDLGGRPLLSNKSVWRRFPVLKNRHWTADNIVLLGDALRTVHFSIGSGTRLALEDAIALARACQEEPSDTVAALARFEAQRRPIVDKLLRGAQGSFLWYERLPELLALSPYQLAYSYMTRSGRVDDNRLRQQAPRFMAALAKEQPDRP